MKTALIGPLSLLVSVTVGAWFALVGVTFLPTPSSAGAPQPLPTALLRQSSAAVLPTAAPLPALLRDGESAVIAAYQRAVPAVVAIEVLREVELPAGHPPIEGLDALSGRGSGFIFNDVGLIATNYHVIAGASKIQVHFFDGSSTLAGVVAVDPARDLAVLQPQAVPPQIQPLTFATQPAQVGQTVLSIGAPFGEVGSLSVGVLAGLGRVLDATSKSPALYDLIQTDAVVNPGSSGGPLLALDGAVIGMMTAIAIEQGGSAFAGVGYAVSGTTLARILPTLATGETPPYAYLGLGVVTVDALLAQTFDLPVTNGLLVTGLAPAGPAAAAGLRAGSVPTSLRGVPFMMGGDILVRVNGVPLMRREQLDSLLAQLEVGSSLTFDVIRDGAEREVIVTAATRSGR